MLIKKKIIHHIFRYIHNWKKKVFFFDFIKTKKKKQTLSKGAWLIIRKPFYTMLIS